MQVAVRERAWTWLGVATKISTTTLQEFSPIILLTTTDILCEQILYSWSSQQFSNQPSCENYLCSPGFSFLLLHSCNTQRSSFTFKCLRWRIQLLHRLTALIQREVTSLESYCMSPDYSAKICSLILWLVSFLFHSDTLSMLLDIIACLHSCFSAQALHGPSELMERKFCVTSSFCRACWFLFNEFSDILFSWHVENSRGKKSRLFTSGNWSGRSIRSNWIEVCENSSCMTSRRKVFWSMKETKLFSRKGIIPRSAVNLGRSCKTAAKSQGEDPSVNIQTHIPANWTEDVEYPIIPSGPYLLTD